MSIPSTPAAVRGVPRVGYDRKKTLLKRIWAARWCYVFMLPSLILTGMFTFYPIFASWYFSMLQWSGFTSAAHFVGLDNYREVVQDRFFWDAFKRSFVFMAASVPIKLTLALVVAIVLNDRALKLAPVFRTFFFIPVVTTTAIVGIVMTFIFSPFNGPANRMLLELNLISRPIDFLGNPETALWTIIGVEIWKWFGIPMIYWLAALQTIPKDLYEAGSIDGASGWQAFRHITAPLLIPFGVIIALITAVNTLNVFALVQTMTQGGPYFSSEVMEVYIYRTAFGAGGGSTVPRLGYASAAAVFFGITVMFFAVLQGLAVRRLRAFKKGMVQEGRA